jgi:hypothetical protein
MSYQVQLELTDMPGEDLGAGATEFGFVVFGIAVLELRRSIISARKYWLRRRCLRSLRVICPIWRGSMQSARNAFSPYHAEMMSRIQFFPCQGNHDYGTGSPGPYFALHALPAADIPCAEQGRYYAFDWG